MDVGGRLRRHDVHHLLAAGLRGLIRADPVPAAAQPCGGCFVETWERIAARVPPLFDHALLVCWAATQANQHIIQSGSLVISQNTMAPMARMTSEFSLARPSQAARLLLRAFLPATPPASPPEPRHQSPSVPP